jgi:micrococcal nuclease
VYKYNCVINRVIDGDTIDVDVDLGFDVVLKNKRVRLSGLDAAESRTKDKKEDYVGEYTRDLLKKVLEAPTEAVLTSTEHKRGKYGRIIGDLYIPSKDLTWSSYLLERGLVLPEETPQAVKTAYWHTLFTDMYGL